MGKSDAEAGLTAWVVVLGDFGRSPRMQYHTLSLSQQPNTRVQVVAYGGSRPLEELTGAANVQINTIGEPAAWMRKLPRLLFLVFKVLQQVLQLLWLMLVVLPRPHSILLQSPPAIPTMALCWLAARRHGARLIIDWHNFGYTIMALTMRPGHWLVRLALKYEKFWGRRGDGAFCVTHAMQQELKVRGKEGGRHADWVVSLGQGSKWSGSGQGPGMLLKALAAVRRRGIWLGWVGLGWAALRCSANTGLGD